MEDHTDGGRCVCCGVRFGVPAVQVCFAGYSQATESGENRNASCTDGNESRKTQNVPIENRNDEPHPCLYLRIGYGLYDGNGEDFFTDGYDTRHTRYLRVFVPRRRMRVYGGDTLVQRKVA